MGGLSPNFTKMILGWSPIKVVQIIQFHAEFWLPRQPIGKILKIVLSKTAGWISKEFGTNGPYVTLYHCWQNFTGMILGRPLSKLFRYFNFIQDSSCHGNQDEKNFKKSSCQKLLVLLEINLEKNGPFCGFPWVETSTGPGGFMICVFIIWRELPKAQPKVVLWRSRESNLRPLVYKA